MTAIDVDLWLDVCAFAELVQDGGVCVRVAGDHVALFVLAGSDAVYAIGNVDPFSGASVLARGIVGDRAGVPKVASPVYKQSFDLRTGVCLDDPDVSVPVWDAQVVDGRVQVRPR
jgi:nitrite reductase (NADH) small subunit